MTMASELGGMTGLLLTRSHCHTPHLAHAKNCSAADDQSVSQLVFTNTEKAPTPDIGTLTQLS